MEHHLHVADGQLELYALDRLPDADLPPFEEHLMICANCQERLDEIGAFALGMRETSSVTSGVKREPRTDWLKWLRRPAAYRFD